MPTFHHDGLNFHYRETGGGIPFVFQHGLGGDVNQPFGLVQPPPGFRMLGLDCRAHGQTVPVGEPAKIEIAAFADDLAAWLASLSIPSVIVGGISMGAAVALNFTLRFPSRVLGLVLSRAAWLDKPHPAERNTFLKIAALIRQHGASRGAELFKQSKEYLDCDRKSPDAAASLLGQFYELRAQDGVIRLERIPLQIPSHSRQDWGAIRVPTLVLANRQTLLNSEKFWRGQSLVRNSEN
jgi:pimeloyl-ACP methyl ester carboxylesterase